MIKKITLFVSVIMLIASSVQAKIYKEADTIRSDKRICENDIDGQEVLCEELILDAVTGVPLTGTLQRYYKDGTVQWEQEYKNGKKDGSERSYYRNGKLSVMRQFSHNLQTGKEVSYYDSGFLKSEYKYQDGRLEGNAVKFDEGGTMIAEEHYKHGRKDGVQKIYYSQSGVLMSEENYVNGKRNGIRKIYLQQGPLIEEAPFKDDRLNGKVKDYDDESGRVLRVRVFENGNLISGWIYDRAGNKINIAVKQEENDALQKNESITK